METSPVEKERHGFQHLKLKLYGRFMLEDQSEHPCQAHDISAGNMTLRADRSGDPGEKVILYLDQLGRIEGIVTRTFDDGFAITVIASDRKREKLTAQLDWLSNRNELDLPEDRRHARIAPRNPLSELHIEDGRTYQCRIIDLSLSGAGIEIDVRPAIGTPVTLGAMKGRVVRHFEDGIAIEFETVQSDQQLESEFALAKPAA